MAAAIAKIEPVQGAVPNHDLEIAMVGGVVASRLAPVIGSLAMRMAATRAGVKILTALADDTGAIGERPRRSEAASKLTEYVGEDGVAFHNKAGDLIIMSKDGTSKVRFDINNFNPHEAPHMHLDELVGGKWNSSPPIYGK